MVPTDSIRPNASSSASSADQRDRFLEALENNDVDALKGLALYLRNCARPLPSVTCELLGLDTGSTYGQAVAEIERLRWILSRQAGSEPSGN